ncbi:hypothetical protein, partial [Kocuria tytonicola]|uniref:hypothetical protein n=1 Tax=Kocuria tytonicola TaxID=2055946 RepID=UPI00197CD6A4
GVMTTHGDAPSNEAPSQEGLSGGSSAVFTMKEAADVAGVSVSTLRRRRSELEEAGASITSAGWKVPMTALIAVGLIHSEGFHAAPPARASTSPAQSPDEAESAARLLERVRELETEVQEWRRRAEVAEARAEERRRALDALQIANETERMALRMLTGQNSHPTQAPATPESVHPTPRAEPETSPETASPTAPPGPRRGFFSRIFSA